MNKFYDFTAFETVRIKTDISKAKYVTGDIFEHVVGRRMAEVQKSYGMVCFFLFSFYLPGGFITIDLYSGGK